MPETRALAKQLCDEAVIEGLYQHADQTMPDHSRADLQEISIEDILLLEDMRCFFNFPHQAPIARRHLQNALSAAAAEILERSRL